MFNKSIAYRLSIYISLAVIGVFLAFIIFAFYFNSRILKDNIENNAENLALKVLMIGEKQLLATREITSNVSDQLMYFAQKDNVPLIVEKLMENYSFINAIHVNIDSIVPNINYHNYFFFRGKDSIIVQKGDGIIHNCVHERKIIEEKINSGKPGWTKTFTCKINNKHVVSYYSPIQIQNKNNELITVGSIVSELSLLELNDSIKNLEINEKGELGYAAIVSQDGTFLTHPDKDYILKRNLHSLPNKVSKLDSIGINHLLHDGLSGTTIAYPEYLDFEKSWVYYTPITETGWTLIFVLPYNQMFDPLYLLVLRMLFFSVLGILIIFLIVTYISNKLIRPLSTVTTELKKFSSLTGDFKLDTLNEVELVSESLDYLQSRYAKFKTERNQVEQLNAQRKKDLLEASEIQMSLINTDFSAFEKHTDIDLYAIYKPARIVSGDLFDFIFLDKDNLFFTIGDVSGKGVSAAFFMSVAQTLLKSNSRLKEPRKIVRATNHRLFTVNQHQFFLTLFCGVLNIKSGILRYCNAAHTSTLVLKENGEVNELPQSHGMPLGLYPNKKYEESIMKLEPGDSIVLYSDGVTELQNKNNKHFGIDRFSILLKELSNKNPKALIEKVEKKLESFKGDVKQTDDITIMVLQFKDKKKA